MGETKSTATHSLLTFTVNEERVEADFRGERGGGMRGKGWRKEREGAFYVP